MSDNIHEYMADQPHRQEIILTEEIISNFKEWLKIDDEEDNEQLDWYLYDEDKYTGTHFKGTRYNLFLTHSKDDTIIRDNISYHVDIIASRNKKICCPICALEKIIDDADKATMIYDSILDDFIEDYDGEGFWDCPQLRKRCRKIKNSRKRRQYSNDKKKNMGLYQSNGILFR
jgi:hypothetical protein